MLWRTDISHYRKLKDFSTVTPADAGVSLDLKFDNF